MGRRVRLVDVNGAESAGVAAAALEIVDDAPEGAGAPVERLERNSQGLFYQIFQTNKFQRWQKEQAAQKLAGGAAG